MSFTIGSLFDGSGGFPLAASLCGGTPKWASEIEPYPIAVTKSRFPNVKHLGSVTDIKGGEIDPVDVITFGSPCQDLSVAGKRAGLKHEANGDDETTRSGLFMEAVRIIKEMREATNGVYPRFALWENVPGAFSSNKGEDFRIVLQELIQIAEPTAVMPPVPEKGWPYADSYCGDGWSIAYRVLDAQYWGVPQRRRRIYLVADFRGECAGKVSFELDGLRGYFETGIKPWQTVTRDAENCPGTADCEGVGVAYSINHQGGNIEQIIEDKTGTLTASMNTSGNNKLSVAYALEPGIASREGGHIYESVSGTLRANAGDNPMAVAYSFDALSSNSMKSSNPHSGCRQVDIAKCLDTTDPNPCKNQGGVAIVEAKLMDAYQHHGWRENNVCGTLTAGQNDTVRGDTPLVCVPYTLKIRSGCDVDANGKAAGKGALIQTNMCATLATTNDQYLFQPVLTEQHLFENHSQDTRYKGPLDVCPIVSATFGMGGNNQPFVVESSTIAIEGNGSRPSHKGDGWAESNVMYTLNTTEQHGVAFLANGEQVVGTLCAGAAQRGFSGGQEIFGGEYHIIEEKPGPVHYIVRRLTPTECARLQGFPDTWGHPIEKTELTDEEYQFWLSVRNTHAAINEKTVKDYTKEQILKWYNGLHTDSSEYKMWGNGIALPNALYMMQGIADVMSEEKVARRKWLDDLLGGCL